MRAKDFLLPENLFEVNMSPSNLKKLASQIPARVGIEFEMIVPDVGNVNDDDDREQEEDMDMDERVHDIDDICRFFDDGDYNTRSDIRDLREELTEKYIEWRDEKIRSEFNSSEGREFFAKWCRENVSEEDVADQVGTPEDLLGDRIPSKEDWEKFIEGEWQEEGTNWDNAFDAFMEEKIDDGDHDDVEFLSDRGIEYMSDVARFVDTYVQWPHWTYPEGDGDPEYNLQQVADDFSEAVGMPANFSTSYHGGYRTEGQYDIEPDSSLSGLGDDAGLEFISPPLPLDEALEQIQKVKDWAKDRGAYTNRSTGLHMNISVPGFNQSNLDFVKLTLLLGDKYLLDRFGRSANTYCKSAMDVIAEAPSTEDKELLFKKLKNNLDTIASKVIHSGRVGKFTSINPKDNRVEFRGPGGDWLGQNFDKVEDTLYRCVVALDAAVDPDKYRKEYLKKLTKMFAPSKGSLEDVFVQYAAGNITRSQLKFKLKTAQAERKRQKYTASGIVEVDFYKAEVGDWIVEYDNPTGETRRIFLKRTEQVSDSNEALKAAIALEPSWFKPDDIENIVVTEFAGNKEYVVLDKSGNRVGEYNSWTPLQAIDIAISYDSNLKREELTAVLKSDYNNTTAGSEQTPPEQQDNPIEDYNLYRVTGTTPHVTRYVAARALGEARRIAATLYSPELGGTIEDLSVMIYDAATPDTINMWLQNQQERLDAMNQPSQSSDWRDRLRSSLPGANGDDGQTASWSGEGQLYNVYERELGLASGGVRIRANSPEQAIERARQAYHIGPERDMAASLASS